MANLIRKRVIDRKLEAAFAAADYPLDTIFLVDRLIIDRTDYYG